MKKWFIGIGSILLILTVLILVIKRFGDVRSSRYSEVVLHRTYDNYGKKVIKSAEKYKLPPEFLLSLIALECSGRRLIPSRFEPKVYEQLIKVQNQELLSYDHVFARHLKDKSITEIKELASSWGPYQLMGYKSFELGCRLRDIKGRNSIEIGTSWIDQTYGEYLRSGRYKDAFHIHNTGRKYPLIGPPRTYHRSYVPQGLKFLDAFKQIIDSAENRTVNSYGAL